MTYVRKYGLLVAAALVVYYLFVRMSPSSGNGVTPGWKNPQGQKS